MNDPTPLLEAILDEPDELPRLAYADWLEERGDPLGGFIRLGCELARCPEGDPRRDGLLRLHEQMLAAHADGWLAPVAAAGGTEVRWDRGLARCRMPLDGFLARHAALTACRCLLGVEAETYGDGLESLHRSLWDGVRPLPRLLGLRTGWPAPEGLEALFGSPLLCRLGSLQLEGDSLPGLLAALPALPGRPRLAALELSSEVAVADLFALIAAPRVPRLTEIRLEVPEPAAPPAWPGQLARAQRGREPLAEVDLSADPWLLDRPSRLEEVLHELGRLEAARSLRSLRLRHLGLRGASLLGVLADAPALAGLTRLDLGGCCGEVSPRLTPNVFPDALDWRGRPDCSPPVREFCDRLREVVLGVDYEYHDERNERLLRELFPHARIVLEDVYGGGTIPFPL